MDKIKKYVVDNFEQFFVLVILVSVALINYFIPYKLAFLNFYFIPVLIAAHYLGLRKSLLGAFFCVLMVVIYATLDPENFATDSRPIDLALNVATWAGFLILTGAVVGTLQAKLLNEKRTATGLSRNLLESQSLLSDVRGELQDYSENLEKKVEERTETLQKSKLAVEELKQKVEAALYSTMDTSVVKLIIEKRLRTEKRRISVLFSDLKAFTRYSEERGPEVVITDLNRFLGDMEDVLLQYNAHIDKYMGDGIIVEFGAPVHYERHALMAVVAGLKMQERLAKGGYPWTMRVGISTGETIIGLIGNHRQSYTAIGDTVNIAARIQGICEPGKVTIDFFTRDAVKAFVDCRIKSFSSAESDGSPGVAKAADELAAELEKNPNAVDALKKLGLLLHGANQPLEAHDCLKKALELDPEDHEIKLAYADVVLRIGREESTALKGKSGRLRLFEVVGIKDPLMDREKIPEALYEACHSKVSSAAEYPENIILPVEVLDGCVGHSKTVGFLSYCMADALDLPDQERMDVLQAGYLLDIGKAIVPHHMLNRAGGLTKDEFQEVVKHSREGVRSLRQKGYETERIFDIIATHHENFNGSGYPEGLSGEKIPLGGRITAVADAYDALTSWRPYRNRWNPKAAFSELEKDARHGKFDPRLISLLGKLLGLRR